MKNVFLNAGTILIGIGIGKLIAALIFYLKDKRIKKND